MGRYYKPSNYNHVDGIYKLPAEAMMKAIAQTDAMVDSGIQQTDMFGNAVANISHLEKDTARVKEIQESYSSQIQAATKSLMEDPTNYRKQLPNIKNLGRQLQSDMQTGEIAAIQSNVAKLNEWDKTYKPLVAKGDITPDAYNAMKSAFIKNYKGVEFDKNSGSYNQVATEDVYKTQDFNKMLQDAVKGIKANSQGFKQTSDGGKWLVTRGGKTEEVSEARIAQIAMDTLMGDQNVMGYLKQGAKYGYLKGIADEQGNFIQPYKLDKRGNPVFDGRSILTAPIRALVGAQAYRQTESESDMKVNPYTQDAIKFENDIKMLDYKTSKEKDDFVFKEGIKLANAEKLAAYKDALDNDDTEKAAAIKKDIKGEAGKLPVIGDKTNPVKFVGTTGEFNISFAPQSENDKITNEDILKSYVADRNAVATARENAKDPNISQEEKNKYTATAIAMETGMKRKAELLNTARQEVNAKLAKQGFKPEDLSALNKIDDKINSLQQQYGRMPRTISMPSAGIGAPGYYKEASPEQDRAATAIKNKLETLKKLKSANEGLMSNWFKNNKEKTAYNVSGVGIDAKQQEQVFDYFKTNPKLFKAILQNGMSTGAEVASADDIDGLAAGFNLVSINKPTAGVPASVTFVEKNPKGVPVQMIVPISGDIQKKLGAQLLKSKDAKKRATGEAISDFSVATTLAELTEDHLINHSEDGTVPKQVPMRASLPEMDWGSGTYTPQIIVEALPDKSNGQGGESGLYKAQITLPNGKQAPIILKSKDGKSTTQVSSSKDALVRAAYDLYKEIPEPKK